MDCQPASRMKRLTTDASTGRRMKIAVKCIERNGSKRWEENGMAGGLPPNAGWRARREDLRTPRARPAGPKPRPSGAELRLALGGRGVRAVGREEGIVDGHRRTIAQFHLARRDDFLARGESLHDGNLVPAPRARRDEALFHHKLLRTVPGGFFDHHIHR